MIVVVGMAFEARIAAGLGARVICSGDGRNLAPTLARAMAAGCRRSRTRPRRSWCTGSKDCRSEGLQHCRT